MTKQAVTTVDQNIGKRIQLRRRELGITAAELSEKLGISQQQLSRYERGSNKINVTHLVNISVYLDVPIGWFFLECESQIPVHHQNKKKHQPVLSKEEDLHFRLKQIWQALPLAQQRALIIFLDALTPL